jgi:hypothetical protein
METDELFDACRAVEPATVIPDPEIFVRQRRRLDETIRLEAETAHSSRITRRPRRVRARRVMALVGLLLSGAAAATAAGVFGPSSHDSSTIDTHFSQFGPYSGPGSGLADGTRPTLDAEKVLCDYRATGAVPAEGFGDVTYSYASAAPMVEPVTLRMLTTACAAGNDSARNMSLPKGVASRLCEVNEGTEGVGPGSPVVVFGNTSCADNGYRDARAQDLLNRMNARRALEASIDSVPQRCPSEQQAFAWVNQRLRALDLHLAITHSEVPGGVCFIPKVTWWTTDGAEIDISAQYIPDANP